MSALRLALVLFFALVFGLACSATEDDDDRSSELTFEIDRAFAPWQRYAIERAAEPWNARTTKPIRFAPDGEWFIVIGFSDETRTTQGSVRSDRKLVMVAPGGLGEANLYKVMVHEFGHALGLSHTARGIMCGAPVSDCDLGEMLAVEGFSTEDIAECRRVGACW